MLYERLIQERNRCFERVRARARAPPSPILFRCGCDSILVPVPKSNSMTLSLDSRQRNSHCAPTWVMELFRSSSATRDLVCGSRFSARIRTPLSPISLSERFSFRMWQFWVVGLIRKLLTKVQISLWKKNPGKLISLGFATSSKSSVNYLTVQWRSISFFSSLCYEHLFYITAFSYKKKSSSISAALKGIFGLSASSYVGASCFVVLYFWIFNSGRGVN